MNDWTARLNPELTRSRGVEELHSVFLEPPGWPGKGTVVALGIPECEFQCVFMPTDDGEPVAMVNQPRINRNVKSWIRFTCEEARKLRAMLIFSCDTPEQAAKAAKRAAKLLPHYRRVAIERMYDAETRVRDRLS